MMLAKEQLLTALRVLTCLQQQARNGKGDAVQLFTSIGSTSLDPSLLPVTLQQSIFGFKTQPQAFANLNPSPKSSLNIILDLEEVT